MTLQKNHRDHAFTGIDHLKKETIDSVCQFHAFWNANDRGASLITELFLTSDYFFGMPIGV
ncbi:MAG TPA: hypothetical protein VGN53_03375 [Klebsiella sp.]|jgi:hypothetical protein